jgi:hypothetical protein
MGRRRAVKDCTLEEFDAWVAKTGRVEAMSEAADETGGPRLSLVPVVDQNSAWPTDLLSSPSSQGDQPEAGGGAGANAADEPHLPAMAFDGVALPDSRKRLAGWSADRQRLFLETLAETGSVHLASSAARLSARSAYRLRTRSPAFAAAWDTALQLSVGRLAAIVFDRAINGRIEQVFEGGDLVAERRVPNDRLLTWLLARLDPRRFALPWEQRGDSDPQAEAVAAFPTLLDAVTDTVAE